LPQDAEPFFAYHVEHIVARQHGGRDDSGNLALACYHSNARKGPNLSGLDPESGALVRLFHPPRQERWDEHFERNGVLIAGRTAVGRATAGLLKMNATDRRRLRERQPFTRIANTGAIKERRPKVPSRTPGLSF